MKILLIASWYRSERAPNRGSFIREQARALASSGVKVGVVVFDRDSKKSLLSVTREVDDELIEFRISVPSPLHRLIGFYFPCLLAKKLDTIIGEFAPDVIHAHAARPGAVVMSLSQSNIPYVVTEHSGPLTDFWMTVHGKNAIKRAYNRAAKVFSVGKTLSLDIERYFGYVNAAVLPNGVAVDMFPKADINEKSDYILVACSLIEGKRVSDIIKAYFDSKIERPLVVLGAGPEMGRLKEQVNSAEGGLGRVLFKGAVDRNVVSEYMRGAHAFVLASEHETFSLVCAEAIASGTFVISSRCGGPEDFVKVPFGGFFDVGKTTELVELIKKIDKFKYDQDFIDKANQYITEQYSMESLVNKLKEIYIQVNKN